MVLSPSHFKEKYKNCSVEELESRFNELRKEVEFKTKKEFLKHITHYKKKKKIKKLVMTLWSHS